MWKRNIIIWFFLLGFLLGWAQIAKPGLVEELPVTADYHTWWAEMELCSGIEQSIEGVTFYAVHDTVIILKGVVYHQGAVDLASRSVYVIQGNERSPLIMKHEILHILLNHAGHPMIPFEMPCHVARIDGEPNLKAGQL